MTVNSEINKLKDQMKTQQVTIEELKTEIKKKRAEIETTYHYEVIREKEDELQNLKRIYNEVKSEQTTMERMIAEQHKAIGERRENDDENVRKQDMLSKLKDVKMDNKKLQEKVYGLEKEVKTQHNLNVKEKLKLREGNQLIGGNKGKHVDDMTKLTAEVERLEAEINEMKKRGDEISNNNVDKFDEIERVKKERKRERDRLEQICKEKDKLVRLNALKLNSIKRAKRYNTLKPIEVEGEVKTDEGEIEEDFKAEEGKNEAVDNSELPTIDKKDKGISKPFDMKR